MVIANDELRDGIGKHAIERIRQHRSDIRALRYPGYPLEELQRTAGINDDVRVHSEAVPCGSRSPWGVPERRRTAGGVTRAGRLTSVNVTPLM